MGVPTLGAAGLAARFASIAYVDQTAGRAVVDVPGWAVDRHFRCQTGETGFSATSFVNHQERSLAVAFRGSDEITDIVSAANLGICQYNPNIESIERYIHSKNPYNIIISGHSLGGALSQYLAYDLVQSGKVDPEKMRLYTFNGLGGVLGIERMHGRCARTTSRKIKAIHYAHPDDVVPNIGGNISGVVSLIEDKSERLDPFRACHMMKCFLGPKLKVPDCNILENVVQRADRPYAIKRTAERAGPRLSQVLRHWIKGEELAAACLFPSLLTSVPLDELQEVLRMGWDILRRSVVTCPGRFRRGARVNEGAFSR